MTLRPEPRPLAVIVRPDGIRAYKWAHSVQLTPDKRLNPDRTTRPTTARCRDCEWAGKYPTYSHARAVADEHMIHTHVTGSEFCDTVAHNGHPRPRTKCLGCAAIKRKALR